jgi:hypothetical protein
MFISTAFFANRYQKDASESILTLIRLDILVLFVIFFFLLALILYFESLLKFARDLNKPRLPIKKGPIGVFVVALLVVIPTIVALLLGVQVIKFHEQEREAKELEESIERQKQRLKIKQSPSEGFKGDNPYEAPLSISEENKKLFDVSLDKKFDHDSKNFGYLPLRVLSYSRWDGTGGKFIIDKDSDEDPLADEAIYPLNQDFSLKNKYIDYSLSYTFTYGYESNAVPQLLTSISTDSYIDLYRQKDNLRAYYDLSEMGKISIQSKVVAPGFSYNKLADSAQGEDIQSYLSMPDDPELKRLVTKIYANKRLTTQEEKVKAIYNYMLTNYKYAPVEKMITSAESPSYQTFLFDTKAGNSLNFSEGLTMLLRSEGIPSRVVTGYVGMQGSSSLQSDVLRKFSIHESDKLFWVEVYYPGAGWTNYFPVSSSTERRALNEIQYDQKYGEGSETNPNPSNPGGPSGSLTPDQWDSLSEDDKEAYKELLEKQKELEQKQQKQKENPDLSMFGALFKIIAIIIAVGIGLIVFVYLFIYPFIRYYLTSGYANKATNDHDRIIRIYSLIVSLARWFGVKFSAGATPTMIIEEIEKAFGISLHGLGWIYNRAVLREQLHSEDIANANLALKECWQSCFKDNFKFRSILYFYRIGRILKKK